MSTAAPVDLERVLANTPERLRERAQWVCWKYIQRAGKATKCPVDPIKSDSASSTNPATWGTFDQAVEACRHRSGLAGIGYVFSATDPFTGIDLDNCIDTETGRRKPWAEDILDQLDSYCEISPSGKGVKVFVRAAKSGCRCKTGYEDGAVEIYDRDRFFTVTGERLPEKPADVEPRQAALDEFYARVFGKSEAPAPPRQCDASNDGPALLDDDEIIRLATTNR